MKWPPHVHVALLALFAACDSADSRCLPDPYVEDYLAGRTVLSCGDLEAPFNEDAADRFAYNAAADCVAAAIAARQDFIISYQEAGIEGSNYFSIVALYSIDELSRIESHSADDSQIHGVTRISIGGLRSDPNCPNVFGLCLDYGLGPIVDQCRRD